MLPAPNTARRHVETLPAKQVSRKKRSIGRRLPETLLVTLPVAVLFGLALLYLTQHVYVLHLGVQIKDAQRAIQQAEQQHAFLQLRLTQARSLAEIERTARDELGMTDPDTTALLILEQEQHHPSATALNESFADEPKLFDVVAEWLNQWIPGGGVEAGRLEP